MATTSGTRCALYLRISLDSTGEQLAVQRQRADCRRIAEQRGWTIVAEFTDNSVSASDRRRARPGYDALVAAFAAGEFDALVCWDLDRLTRQPRQLEDWIDAAEDRGLLLVTANGEADLSTDGGRLFARMKAAVARSEVDRKSARQRSAALQRSQHGKPPMGVRLTGYTPRGDLVEHEADVVRKVFRRFDAGDSLRSISSWLAETGIPTRHGRPWHPSSVRTILTNPRYAGRAVYQGATTGGEGGWVALVDGDTFDAVQARLADPRRRTQQGTHRKHLGAGLYLCAVCESPVRSFSGNRYRCPQACITRSQGAIDEVVVRLVRAVLARPDVADLLQPEDSERARAVGAQVRRLRARLESVEADYDAGDIDGRRFKVASAKVAAELAEAQRAQARLAADRGAASILAGGDPVAAFDAAPLMLRRVVIEALCTVRLASAPRGRRTFDPDSVQVEPRRALPPT